MSVHDLSSNKKFLRSPDEGLLTIYELKLDAPNSYAVQKGNWKLKSVVSPDEDTLLVNGSSISGDMLQKLQNDLCRWGLTVNGEGFCYVRSTEGNGGNIFNLDYCRLNDLFSWSDYVNNQANTTKQDVMTTWNRCDMLNGDVLVDYDGKEREAEKLRECVKLKEEELNNVKEELKRLHQQLSSSKSELQSQKEEMEKKAKELKQVQEELRGVLLLELDSTKVELATKKKELESKEKEFKEVEEKVRILQRQLSSSEANFQMTRQDLKKKEEELKKAKEEVETLRPQLWSAEAELKFKKQELENKEKELNVAEEKSGALIRRLSCSKAELKVRKEELQKKEEEFRTTEEESFALLERLSFAESGLQFRKELMKKKEEESKKLKEDLNILQKQLCIYAAQLKRKNEELEMKGKELKEVKDQLSFTLVELKSCVEEQEKKQNELKQVRGQLSSTQAELESCKTEWERKEKQLKDQLSSSRVERETNDNRLKEVENELGSLKKEFAALQEVAATVSKETDQHMAIVLQNRVPLPPEKLSDVQFAHSTAKAYIFPRPGEIPRVFTPVIDGRVKQGGVSPVGKHISDGQFDSNNWWRTAVKGDKDWPSTSSFSLCYYGGMFDTGEAYGLPVNIPFHRGATFRSFYDFQVAMVRGIGLRFLITYTPLD